MPIGRLWLTVFDDHGGAQWPPSIEGSRVVLTESNTLLDCGHTGPYRTSPVFPLADNFKIPLLEGATVHFWFLCFDPAYAAMGRVCGKADEQLLSQMLFSAGLASVVLIGETADMYDKVVAIVGSPPRSYEHWTVIGGGIKSIDCYCAPAQPVTVPRMTTYNSLPVVAKTAIDEFISGMELLAPKVAAHLPSELPVFLDLVGKVDELAREMTYVSSPRGNPPDTLSEYGPHDFSDRSDRAHQVLFQTPTG